MTAAASTRARRSGLGRLFAGAASVSWHPAEPLEVLTLDAPVPAEFLGREPAQVDLSPDHRLGDPKRGGDFIGAHPFLRHAASLANRSLRQKFTTVDVTGEKRYSIEVGGDAMRTIPLGRSGLVTLVDDDDFERFGRMRWHVVAKRYAGHSLPAGKTAYLHRLITGAEDGTHVDHINHDTLDNRRSNLRVTSVKQNLENRASVPSNSTTGRLGVYWDKARQKYHAQVHHNGKSIHLGRFTTLDEADAVARTARQRLFTHAAPWMLPEATP